MDAAAKIDAVRARTFQHLPVLLYIRVPALESEAQWRTDPVLSIVGMRQYVDWRPLRHLDVRTPTVREQIERFCDKIVEALREPWVSSEEHQKLELEAQQRAEERRAETVRQAEAERQQAEEEKQRTEAARQAEAERQQAEEEKQRVAAASRRFCGFPSRGPSREVRPALG